MPIGAQAEAELAAVLLARANWVASRLDWLLGEDR